MTKPLEYTTFPLNPEFYRLAFQRNLPALVGLKNRGRPKMGVSFVRATSVSEWSPHSLTLVALRCATFAPNLGRPQKTRVLDFWMSAMYDVD